MYYLEKKLFNKEVKNIYYLLFDGFSFFERFLNKENKYKEHFSNFILWDDIAPFIANNTKKEKALIKLNEKKEKLKEQQYSDSYLMGRKKRFAILRNSLSKALGFSDYKDYIKKIKGNNSSLKHIDNATISELFIIKDSIYSNIINDFNFKEEPLIPIVYFLFNSIENKKELVFKDYLSLPDFFNNLSFYLSSVYILKENIEEIIAKSDTDSIIKFLKNLTSYYYIREEIDLYSYKNISTTFDKLDELNLSDLKMLLNDCHYSFDLLSCHKEIKKITDEDFDSLYQYIKEIGSLSDTVAEILRLIKYNDEHYYLKFLSFVKQYHYDENDDNIKIFKSAFLNLK